MPPRAPRAAVAQDVGLTRISVEYRSVAVRGRSPWGTSVPLGEPWRGGDSPQAVLALSRDVTVAGKPVPAGTYALVPTPAAENWTFAFEPIREASAERADRADVRVEVPVEPADARERLRFSFSSFTTASARLDLEWERVRVSLPIAVDTDGQILSAIAELDRRDAGLGEEYERAASLLLKQKGSQADRDKGRAFLERASALSEIAAPAALPVAIERSSPSMVRATRSPGADEIGPVVTKGRPAIQACYQRALRRDPAMAGGKITVVIAVGTSGRVKSVDVSAPEGLRAVEACVKTAVAGWAFPPSPEAYATELPLVLDRHD